MSCVAELLLIGLWAGMDRVPLLHLHLAELLLLVLLGRRRREALAVGGVLLLAVVGLGLQAFLAELSGWEAW